MSQLTKFENRISRFSSVRRGIKNRVLALSLSFKGLTAIVAGLLLLNGILPNPFFNLTLFLILFVYLAVLPCVMYRKFSRFKDFLQEAFFMEALDGNLNSRLVSALDFMKDQEQSPLKKTVITEAESDLQKNFEEKLDKTEFQKSLKSAGLMFVFCTVLAVFLGKPMINNLTGSINEAYNILYPVEYVLTPAAGKPHVFPLKKKVEISIEFNRESIKNAELILQEGDEDPESIPVKVVNRKAAYTLTSDVSKNYKAYFQFGERKSEVIDIVFTTNPVLENMQTELIYPSYTRMLPKSLEGIQQRVTGLDGTRITFGFNFSKEISRATFQWDDGTELLDLDVVGRFASISLINSKNRTAILNVEDIHGLKLEAPLQISFDIQKDEKPQVKLPRFLKKDMPMKISEAKAFSFGARLQDDFGVKSCVLVWKKASVDNPNAVKDKGEIERQITPQRRKAIVDFAKVFESMNFQPGDKIIFQVKAFDNHRPNAQSVQSPSYSFFIFKDELDDWNLKQAGFGSKQMLGKMRITKTKRDTTVKAPPGMRTKEKFINEFTSENGSTARTATVRGKYQKATSDYFKLMTEISNENGGDE